MGHRTRFKWQRAMPVGYPAFQLNHFKPVRELSATTATATAVSGLTALASVTVPANSWAIGKVMRITVAGELTVPPAGVGGGAAWPELSLFGAHGTCGMFIPNAPVALPGKSQMIMIVRAIRLNPAGTDEIWVWNEGTCMEAATWSQANNATRYQKMSFGAFAPDFSIDNVLSYNINMTGTNVGNKIVPLWARSFIESPINLGSLAP